MEDPPPLPEDTKQPGVELTAVQVASMGETGRIMDNKIKKYLNKQKQKKAKKAVLSYNNKFKVIPYKVPADKIRLIITMV